MSAAFPGVIPNDGNLDRVYGNHNLTASNPPEGVTQAVWGTFRIVAGATHTGSGSAGDDLEFAFMRRNSSEMQKALREAMGMDESEGADPKQDAREFLQTCSEKLGEFGMPEKVAVGGWDAALKWIQDSK